MTLLEVVTAWVELGASQEDCQSRDYAEQRINSMTNYQLLEEISDALANTRNEKTGS